MRSHSVTVSADRRHLLVSLLAISALAVSACAGIGTSGPKSASSSSPAQPSASPSATPPVPVGFGGGQPMMYLPDSQLAREFDAVKASGATWIRVDVDWSDV